MNFFAGRRHCDALGSQITRARAEGACEEPPFYAFYLAPILSLDSLSHHINLNSEIGINRRFQFGIWIYLSLRVMLNPFIENVVILVDDRERPSGVPEELGKLSGVVVRIEHLAVGDYSIDGAVLIERKSAKDFAQSLTDGRLFRQAKQMSNSPLRTAYILEGSSAEWFGLGVSRESMLGALVTLMLIFDIPVFRSSGPAESAKEQAF